MWQWVKRDGTAARWGAGENNFVNQPANQNMVNGVMDLYPVTVTLAATDSAGVPYTGIEAQLELDDTTNTLSKATVTLQESYNQPWMKIHIEEVAYALGTDGTVTGTMTRKRASPSSSTRRAARWARRWRRTRREARTKRPTCQMAAP